MASYRFKYFTYKYPTYKGVSESTLENKAPVTCSYHTCGCELEDLSGWVWKKKKQIPGHC